MPPEGGEGETLTKADTPDVIRTQKGGGCLIVFGLPFLLAGAYTTLASVGVVPADLDPDQPRILLTGMGLLFAVAGAGLMFARSGTVLDRRRDTLTRWWGLLVPMKTRHRRLSLFNRISLSRERRGSGKSRRTVYPVKLLAREGEDAVEYEAPGDYQQARRSSEKLARFLDLSLEDSSTGTPVVREAAHLDDSLREQAQRSNQKLAPLSAPPDMRSSIRKGTGSIAIEIPAPGLQASQFLRRIPALLFACVAGVLFLPILLRLGGAGPLKLGLPGVFMLVFVGLPVGVSLLHALSKARKSYTINVSVQGLAVEEGGITGARAASIPADELEDLELVGGKGQLDSTLEGLSQKAAHDPRREAMTKKLLDPSSPLGKLIRSALAARAEIVARSDTTTLRFGRGLPIQELAYLYGRIKETLTE